MTYTATLDFDYNDSTGNYEASHSGYTVEAINDGVGAENPWKAWDMCKPLAVKYSGGLEVYSDEDILNPFTFYSDAQINRQWKALTALLSLELAGTFYNEETGLNGLVSDLLEEWGVNPNKPPKGYLADARREVLEESEIEDFDTIAAIYGLIGIRAMSFARNGYVQSQWAELLLVNTPSHRKACGYSKAYEKANFERMATNAADLYAAWAYGDVYGYRVTDSQGEEVDSCRGFYGNSDTFDTNGLSDGAMSAIEYDIDSRRKAKATRLIELIKNRVPLGLRAAELAQV